MQMISSDDPLFQRYHSMLFKMNLSSALYTTLDIKSLIEYRNEINFSDKSIIVVNNKVPILGIIITEHTLDGNGIYFTAFGRPIFYFESSKIENNIMNSARKKITEYLGSLIKGKNFNLRYVDYLHNNHITQVSKILIEKGAVPKPFFSNVVNLNKSENFLWLDLRKRFRKNIKWSDKNMSTKIFTSKNCDMDLINQFKRCHIQAAGKQTRNDRTWEIQHEQIMKDEAFLVAGLVNNEYVSFVFVNYLDRISYYYAGASDRDKFDKPINHKLIWDSILYSKELGCDYFDLGEKLFTSSDKKLLGISQFKSGFTQNVVQRLEFIFQC